MQVAVVQYDIIWEDKPANHAIVERLLEQVNLPSGTFVLLPELGDTGFSFNLDVIVDDQTLTWGAEIARRHSIYLQVGYAALGDDGKGRNNATIIGPDGETIGTYQKVHPFSYGREIEHFTGGDHVLVRTVHDAAIAPLICYDLRFPELWRLATQAGAHVFTIGASWPDARQAHWRTLLIARAIENQAYVVAVNRIGRDPHLGYAGGSIIIDPAGTILAEADQTESVLTAEVDPAKVRDWRATFPALNDIKPGMLGSIRTDVADSRDLVPPTG